MRLKIILAAVIAVLPFGVYAQYEYEPFSDGVHQTEGYSGSYGERYDGRYHDNEFQFLEADKYMSAPPPKAAGDPPCAGKLCPFCGSAFLNSSCQCPSCGYDGSPTLSTPVGNPLLPMLIMALMFGAYLFVRKRKVGVSD